MLFRMLYALNRWYALAVLWIYIALFVLAFALMFIFPPASLAMVFLGVIGLGVAGLAFKAMHAAQSALVRRMISRGQCPLCSETNQYGQREGQFACVRCNAVFLDNGMEVEASRDHAFAS